MIHLDADSVIEGIVQWCSRLRDIKDDAAFEIAWTETWAWITGPLRAATLNALLDGNENPSMCELIFGITPIVVNRGKRRPHGIEKRVYHRRS